MPKKSDYRVPSVCHVCGGKFMARYNVADRAKVCTTPGHKCRKGTKHGKKTPCLDGCCRSKYYRGASAAASDSAVDPRYVLAEVEFDGMWKSSRKIADPEGTTLRFIARTGCRLEESRLIFPNAVEWMRGPISIVRIPTIKRSGRPIRQVHLNNKDAYTDELRKWVKQADAKTPLFPVARRTLQRALERILEPIKPDRASLVHILRHTRASQLIAAGANWNYVRQQLGWARLEMAKRYVHTDQETIAQVLGKI
ncbi:MAG: tyrosine-type recombinase/integrase [Thermoplasmata archaeon]